MPKALYDLSTGFDNNSLLNLKIDTFERMNKLEEDLNIPDYKSIPIPEYKPFIPKEIDSDSILKGDQKLPSLKEALNSDNREIRKAAEKAMEMQAVRNPVYHGVGTTQKVPYTEGQEKFTDNSWLKGRRNTMYGYNPYISMDENEDFMNKHVWDSYTNFGKAWRGVGLFTGRTLSKAVTGLVGLVGDIGSIVWNGLQELGDTMNINDGTKNNFWYDVSNNWLSRKMEEADNHVKQQWLPTYKAMNYDNKGAWEKLMDPYTWTNSFADGAGFLLQFAVPGAMLGKIGQAGRLASRIGQLEEALVTAQAANDAVKVAKLTKTIAQAKNVNAFTKAMGYDINNKFAAGFARTFTGSDNVGGISAHVFNTMMESVAETKEGFNSTVEELMRKGISRDKAIEIAGENAPGQFWINTAILTASNAFENKLLQKAVNNRRLTLIDELDNGTLPKNLASPTTKVGKFFENNAWGNRIKFYGTNAAKSSFWEGFWEENAQTAAARWAKGEYNRQGDDGGATEEAGKLFVSQLWKQTKDAIKGNDREAADSIMAGAVIGILGNAVFSKLASTRGEIYDTDGKTILKPKTFLPEGQRKAEIRQKAQKVATFINTRDAWLSINTFGGDIYNKDGTVNQEKADKKTEEIREKLSKINSVFGNSLKTEDLLDDISKNLLESKVFTEYVKAHILNETGDALVGRLESWNTKTPEELSIYGVTEETKDDANKWSSKAKSLVEAYDKYKDIKYAAPSDTLLSEYQNITSAIRSVLLDYTGYRDIAKEMSSKYNVLMEQNNPFSDHPELQDYNQNQVKLIKLRQKLENEELDIVQKQAIEKQIEEIEKEQKAKKETFATQNETKESKEGLVYPKDTDQKKEAERIAQYQDFFENLGNKVDSDIETEKFNQLIKEYSDPKTGYSKFVNGVEYFDNAYNKPADEKVAADTVEEIKKTTEELKKEVEELKSNVENATTKEERDSLLEKIKEKEEEIAKQEEEILATDTTVIPEEITDIPELPTEKQYGTDDYIEQALAYVTPFKTVNKETIDFKDKEGNRLWWKEVALEHGYDHDLTVFAKFYQNELVKFPDKYELFVIKDTVELMKQRLSKTQMESFDEGNFKEGAVVVFREKGKQEWLTFKSGKTVAFSYNQEAFNYNYDERVRINSERTNRSASEVIEFFKKQQAILEAVREAVISQDVQIPIKSISGSLGIYPTTKAGNALERFGEFVDNNEPIVIIKSDNKNQVKDALEGQVYLSIPEGKTVNGKKAYIYAYTSTLEKGEPGSIQEKVYNSIQAIQLTTFKTKKEASDIIRNYLYNFFYVNETNHFKIKETQSGFKIVYEDKKGENANWLNTPRLKISDKLYNTEEGFSLYEKKDNVFQPTAKISKEEYRSFINNHLLTNRKVVVQNVKNAGYKVYTEPVNAYLNLSAINDDDVMAGVAPKTTEQVVIQPIAPLVVSRNTEILKEIAILEDRIKTSNNFINNTDSNDAIRRSEKQIEEYEKDIKKLKEELAALEKSKAGSVGVEAKKTDIERLEKEKQKTLQPLIEEKEQIEKEIEEIEKNDDGSVKQEAETIDDFLKNNNITEQQLKDEENKLKNHLDELGLKLDTEYNFEDIINRIIKNVKGRFLKTVLKGINSLVGNKLKTKFVFSSVRHEDAAGQYFSYDDTIKIYIPNLSLRVFTLNKRGKEYQQETNIVEVFNKVFIHELIHAFTILKIRATETNAKLGLATIMNPSIEKERLNISRSDQKTIDSLNKIFDFLKNNELLKGEYGVSDIVELVTEALSNEGFAEKLKNIELPKELRYKSSNNNVFENIILYISKLVEDLLNLGSTYTDDNALESIAAIINDFGSSYSESDQQSFMKINKAEERAREYFKYGKSNQSDNLGSELTKLQQLKQRLAEVNKKINEVTKRFNAQIAQKQSELKALEEQSISAKKANIERRRQGLNGIEEIVFSNPNFRLEGFEIDGNYWNVVTSTDRAKVLVNINGVIVPFYLTTGQAGKGLVPGWYPFFGIGKDGWLNKTDKSDMETYYERYWGKETSDIVKSISEELNSFYGSDPSTFKNDGDPNATSRPLTTLADKVEDYINSKLNYTPAINNADARKTLRSNVEQLGKEINAKYDAELAALKQPTQESNVVETTTPKGNTSNEEKRGDALERIGVDRQAPDGLQRKEWKEARDYDLGRAISIVENQLNANPNSKIGSIPMNAANAIRAELEMVGVKTTDKTPLSEIIDKIKAVEQSLKEQPKAVSKPEDDALLTLIKKHIKGDSSNSIVHRQPLQYFIDKAGEAPMKAVREFGGVDIVKELLSRLSIEKLQENYNFLANIDATSQDALALEEIIIKLKKTGKIVIPAAASEEIVAPKVDLPLDQELKIQLETLKENLKTVGPMVAKANQVKIDQIEKQLKEMEKPKEDLSPLEKLRAIANEGVAQQQVPSIVPHVFEGNPFKIDFENDTIEGYFEDSDKEYSQDFFESFNPAVYKKAMLKNNGLNFYFVKHNVLGKFVTFDENMRTYKVSELPKAILESSEFKNIENCN